MESKYFRRCLGRDRRVEVLILIPKESYNTCNFSGGGGLDLLTPTLLWIHNSETK